MCIEHSHKLFLTYDSIAVLIHFPKSFQEFLLILIGIQLRSYISINNRLELVLELQLIKKVHGKILGSCTLPSRFSFNLILSVHFPSTLNSKLIQQLCDPQAFSPAYL
jgi:hypothetical protein